MVLPIVTKGPSSPLPPLWPLAIGPGQKAALVPGPTPAGTNVPCSVVVVVVVDAIDELLIDLQKF